MRSCYICRNKYTHDQREHSGAGRFPNRAVRGRYRGNQRMIEGASRMKIGLMFANAGPFSQPELLAHLAVTAEKCGVESLWTGEVFRVGGPLGALSDQSTLPTACCIGVSFYCED
jgi:hypothetical protein